MNKEQHRENAAGSQTPSNLPSNVPPHAEFGSCCSSYGIGSEIDDEPIYHKAWIYRQENEEFQNLNIHETNVAERRIRTGN